MNSIELPTEKTKAVDYNPRLLILYGKPKCGKSTIAAAIEDNLIVDLEDGYRALNVMKVQARTAGDLFKVAEAIQDKTKKDGKKPYKFITIDNATRLEEMAVAYATYLYRQTPMGIDFGVTSISQVNNPVTGKMVKKRTYNKNSDVRTLPKGAGYLYMRKAVMEILNKFIPLAETLILICHTKDRQITLDSEDMNEMSVDLSGKTGDIICGMADAIGYVYRKANDTFISFESGDNNIKGARSPHLRGKVLKVAESDSKGNLKVDISKLFV